MDEDLANEAIFDALLKLIDPHAVLLGTNPAPVQVSLELSSGIEEWPEGILYLQPGGFAGTHATTIVERLKEWSSEDNAGIILDLRGAGGDQLDEATQIAGIFVDNGKALYEIRNGSGQVLEIVRAERDGRIPKTPPVMILIDENTHAASELLAASLAGHSGVMVLGSPSRGDAGLREVITLTNTQRLYVATRWIVPSMGEPYDRTGVRPHIPIKDDGPRDANPPVPFKDGDAQDLVERILKDPALSRATDLLLGLKALRKP
jgi:carboxyl-terminal processing protease